MSLADMRDTLRTTVEPWPFKDWTPPGRKPTEEEQTACVNGTRQLELAHEREEEGRQNE